MVARGWGRNLGSASLAKYGGDTTVHGARQCRAVALLSELNRCCNSCVVIIFMVLVWRLDTRCCSGLC